MNITCAWPPKWDKLQVISGLLLWTYSQLVSTELYGTLNQSSPWFKALNSSVFLTELIQVLQIFDGLWFATMECFTRWCGPCGACAVSLLRRLTRSPFGSWVSAAWWSRSAPSARRWWWQRTCRTPACRWRQASSGSNGLCLPLSRQSAWPPQYYPAPRSSAQGEK